MLEPSPPVIGRSDVPLFALRHAGTAIVVVAVGDAFVVVSQYRPILGIRTLEFPGGVIESGEAPPATACREFVEETGLVLKNPTPLGSFFASVGTSDERVHIFTGTCDGVEALAQYPEHALESTTLEPGCAAFLVRRDLLIGMVDSRALEDGKTALALLLWSRLEGRQRGHAKAGA